MKKLILKTALLACAAFAGNAQAVGVVGQGTWETRLEGRDINGAAVTARDGFGVLDASAVFLYDDVLDVTWLRNANYAQTSGYDSDGRMRWPETDVWVTSLTIGNFDDWRLPTLSNPTEGFVGDITSSEMASLWYGALGNVAGSLFDAEGTFTNAGDFQNMQGNLYWSGLKTNDGGAWYFNTFNGFQYVNSRNNPLYAMAVIDGDVLVSAVPEPETYALMLAGLALVGAAARRRKAK